MPDRGPFDGRTDVQYLDRFHFLRITVNPNVPFPNITTVLLETRFLKSQSGESFTGDAYAFAHDQHAAQRLDPEGVAISRDAHFFVSDEYGPYVFKFNRQGQTDCGT